MINNDRIVPIVKMDLLTMIGTILGITGTTYAVIQPTDVIGDFSVTGTGSVGNKLASQPVTTLDFASGVTAGTVYFVAAYDFSAITVAGAAATIDDAGLGLDDIQPDGVTLYKAVLGSGEVTITAVSPVASSS